MAEAEQDLYAVLGLPGGTDGANVTPDELKKAYHKRVLACHPDKRPNDASAAADEFLRVQQAYDVLSSEVARKAYDDLQRLRKQRHEKQLTRDSKRQKMMQDLQQAEAAHHAAYEQERRQKTEEETAVARLKAEIEKLRARKAAQRSSIFAELSKPNLESHSWLDETDKQNSVKVTWESSRDYSAQKLREIFEAFGGVKDVMIMGRKKKGSAVVIMDSLAAVNAATQSQCGDVSNPLLVKPLNLTATANLVKPVQQQEHQQQENCEFSQKKEDSILEKLLKAQEKKRSREEKVN